MGLFRRSRSVGRNRSRSRSKSRSRFRSRKESNQARDGTVAGGTTAASSDDSIGDLLAPEDQFELEIPMKNRKPVSILKKPDGSGQSYNSRDTNSHYNSRQLQPVHSTGYPLLGHNSTVSELSISSFDFPRFDRTPDQNSQRAYQQQQQQAKYSPSSAQQSTTRQMQQPQPQQPASFLGSTLANCFCFAPSASTVADSTYIGTTTTTTGASATAKSPQSPSRRRQQQQQYGNSSNGNWSSWCGGTTGAGMGNGESNDTRGTTLRNDRLESRDEIAERRARKMNDEWLEQQRMMEELLGPAPASPLTRERSAFDNTVAEEEHRDTDTQYARNGEEGRETETVATSGSRRWRMLRSRIPSFRSKKSKERRKERRARASSSLRGAIDAVS